MTTTPSLLEMLKAGVHFGHQKAKWYPKMKEYIFTERNGVHILDLNKTQKKLEEALDFVRKTTAAGGLIMIVGTKKQAQASVLKHGLDSGMPYVKDRWLGGTLTNFGVIMKLVTKYKTLRKKKESGELEKYTKKEQLTFTREIEKLDKLVGGISNMEKFPQGIFIVDVKKDKTALFEARNKNLPVIALCDSNTNPGLVDYVIPCNDDATRAIEMMVGLIAEAAKEGKAEHEKKVAEDKAEREKQKSAPVAKVST